MRDDNGIPTEGKTRRTFLRSAVTSGSLGVLATGVAAARGDGRRSSGENILHQFDPDDPEDVSRAYRQLLSLPNQRAADNVLRSLSDSQLKALVDFGKDVEITYSYGEVDQEVSTSSNSKTLTAVSKIKNRVGGTEATFEHHVYWEYDGDTVTDISHWSSQGTGLLYYYRGLDTNYKDIRGEWAVSRRSGIFEKCLTNWGCVQQHTIGTEIWVNGGGGWAVNQL